MTGKVFMDLNFMKYVNKKLIIFFNIITLSLFCITFNKVESSSSILSIETFEGLSTPYLPSTFVSNSGNWRTYNTQVAPYNNVLYPEHYFYNANSSYQITHSPINLSNSTEGATISFTTGCDTEYTATYEDYMTLQVIKTGSSLNLISWNESSIDIDRNPSGGAIYTYKDIPIPSNYLTSDFRYRIIWTTDGDSEKGSVGDGCWIDDIIIAKGGAPYFGRWNQSLNGYGGSQLVPVPADYDGDGKSDISIKTNDGKWLIDYAVNSFGKWDESRQEYGGSDLIPVPADYDGDKKADISIKTNDGVWLIDYKFNGFGTWDETRYGYGTSLLVPVPRDYDGDGKIDLSVKTNDGKWLIDYKLNGFGTWDESRTGYGSTDLIPVPADYDGDNKTDLSVKTNNGNWLIDYKSNGFGTWDESRTGYGSTDLFPVPKDYDGDKKYDLSVKTNGGKWLIDFKSNNLGFWDKSLSGYGGSDLVPVPEDYDGDGKSDISVKTNDGAWLIDYSSIY